MPRPLAEACTRHLETSTATELQALSLFEADETGAAWQIEAYFGSAEEAAEACRSVKSIAQFAACASTVEELAKADWVRQSLRGLTAIKVGRFFIHGSHDRALRPSNGIAIEINAATAFGTGHHGSTRGCLLALETLLRKHEPRRVIDIGSGSGILAIAASRALRRRVLACDIDVEAVQITAANARLNGAAVTAVVAAGTRHRVIEAAAPYDLILANILARPLVQLAPSLIRITARGGHLILSGLLAEQRKWVASVYRALGFTPANLLDDEGWLTLVMRRA
ncbi:MAG: 50S ribosomal protein L11 methyltransferase [Aestuariivirgaceae bacterium]